MTITAPLDNDNDSNNSNINNNDDNDNNVPLKLHNTKEEVLGVDYLQSAYNIFDYTYLMILMTMIIVIIRIIVIIVIIVIIHLKNFPCTRLMTMLISSYHKRLIL